MYEIWFYQRKQEPAYLGNSKSLSAAQFVALRASRINVDGEYVVRGEGFVPETYPRYRDGAKVS